MFDLPRSTKRKLTGLVLAVHLFTVVTGSVFFPTPASAVLGVGDVSITAADIPRIAFEVLLQALKQVGSAIKITAVEVATYLGQKVAHDAAVHLVAGASGQKPLFSAQDASQYALDLGKDVAAQTLSGFVDHLAGIDICTFDPRANLSIAVGFAGTIAPTGRQCNFAALSKRFTQVKDEVATFSQDPARGFASRFSVQFVPGNSTLDGFTQGIFGTYEQVQQKAQALKDAEVLDRLGTIKPVKDPVTGKVKTPKEVLTEKILDDTVKKPARDIERSLDAALKVSAEEVVSIVALSAKTFVATLLGEATKKIFAGLAPTPQADLVNPFAGSGTGIADAQQALRSMLAVQPAAVAQYDAIGSFSSCPQGAGMQRNPDTCVMDQQFASAVRRGSTSSPITVQDAVRQGFLKADFPFIGPNDARNQASDCYLQGYCYSNLVKLRRSRVISIGWEIAAIVAERERPGTTLREVVDSFEGTNLSSFKRLIDPNWILKYPPTQCRQMVNGATLLSDRTPNRHEICVDTPSCVSEDGNGNCIGTYGYCTQEKNVWRFDGDACPKEMSSCLAFARPEGGRAAYLTNTLDAAGCSSSTIGCRNYLLNPAPVAQLVSPAVTTTIVSTAGTGLQFSVANGAYENFFAGDLVRIGADDVSITKMEIVGQEIKMTVSKAVVWSGATAVNKLEITGSSIYLNKNAGSCNSSDKGCTELVDLTTKNTPANLIQNPSFETDSDGTGLPDLWNGTATLTNGSAALGAKSITLGVGQTLSQYVALQANSFYTISVAAKTVSGSSGSMRMSAIFQRANGTSVGVANTSASIPVTGAYGRISYKISTPNEPVIALVSFVQASASISLDSAQIEFGEEATVYHEAYASDAAKVFMKAPPAVLGCTGAPTDKPECSSYAGVCSSSDVGCERYTPTNGDAPVAGSLSRLDLCPSSCAGYDTFKQLGYDDTSMAGAGFERAKFPVFFSPTFPGARVCSVAAAGCDEFTNLQRASEGGEAREYYTKLRKCQVTTVGDNTANYYTWEGSDTAGLQLRTWALRKSDVSNGPCALGGWNGDGTSAIFECVDDAIDLETQTGLTANQPTCDSHDDVSVNPDCREFYDEEGDVHYRLLSSTIISAAACTQFRKTQVAAGAEGQSDCSATGGRFASATGECVYFALPESSQSCTVQENGCRAYRGNAGANTRMVLNQTFETVVPNASGVVAGYTGTYSTESLAANGHSLRSSGSTVEAPLDGLLQAGRTYQVSFWAKANPVGGLNASILFNSSLSGGVGSYSLMTPSATLEWQRFISNPITITVGQTELTPKLRITGGTFWVDNIEIREVQSTVAFVKNSWTTPIECNQTAEGAASPQEMLGCREYTDRAGRRVTARSFSRLCSDNAVGCKAFADTQNSTSVGQQIFNARCYASLPTAPVGVTTACTVLLANGTTTMPACSVLPGQSYCRFNTNNIIRMSLLPATLAATDLNKALQAPDTVVVSTDTVRYLVDDPSKRCSEEAKGCYEFGAAQYSQDQQRIVGVGKRTLLNLPDQYATSLCGQESNFCDAFGGDDGSVRYFKDPESKVSGAPVVPGKLCEYRDDAIVNGESRSGWFKKGTNLPCYDNFIIGGGFNGIRKNADPSFESWGGACAPALSKCTEFRDPTDKSEASPLGKSYFFLKNERVTQNTCNQVSRREGCALFEDTTNPTKLWNADASYAASDANGGALVGAVSCETDPNNIACKNRCRLSFADITGTPEPTRLITNQLCVRDEDCSGVTRPGKRVTDARCVDITNSANTDASIFEMPNDEVLADGDLTNDAGKQAFNNVNMMLKVRRDRECGEWLSCTTSSPVYDSAKQETREICNEVRTCNLSIETNQGGSACASFVETPRDALTRGAYQDRDTSWKGGDISGYSVPGMVPLDRVSQVNVAGKCATGSKVNQACLKAADCAETNGNAHRCVPNPDDPDLRMAHRLGTALCTGSLISNGDSCSMGYCRNNPTLTCQSSGECGNPTLDLCSFDSVKAGRCFDGACVQLAGNAAEVDNPRLEEFDVVLRQPEALSCRAYPENDGPVAATAVEQWRKTALVGDTYIESSSDLSSAETVQWTPLRMNPQYNGANVCSFAKTADGRTYRLCECRYSKATYGGATIVKYYPQGARSRIKPYVCSGGPNAGAACNPADRPENDACGPEGQCTALQKIDNAQGVTGYCLQRDLSVNVNGEGGGTACALWLPVDALPGSVDIYNQDETAGFVPPEDDLYYCAESKGRSKPNLGATQGQNMGTLVNETGNSGIICQETSNSCNTRTSNSGEDACESNSNCKWVDSKCKTYIWNFPEPPDLPGFPAGCGAAPGPTCDNEPNGGSYECPPFTSFQDCTDNSCGGFRCTGGAFTCTSPVCPAKPVYTAKFNGDWVNNNQTCSLPGGVGIDQYLNILQRPLGLKVEGDNGEPCLIDPPAPPSGDLVVNSCTDIDDLIIKSAIMAGVSWIPYVTPNALIAPIASGFFATIAGTALARCATLAVNPLDPSSNDSNTCGFAQRLDRYAFSAINEPVSSAFPDLPAPPAVAGFSIRGASGVRTASLRADPADFSQSGLVGLYGDGRNIFNYSFWNGDTTSNLLAKNISKDEIAAIRVTTSGRDADTNAMPRQFFLLPPNFEASFWWNGGPGDDSHRTDVGKAITFNRYESKCGDPGVECRKQALGKTCRTLFSSSNECVNLADSISMDNETIENCAAIQMKFKYCDSAGENCDDSPTAGKFETLDGFESGMCIRSNTHGGSLPVKVDVLLKESCDVLTQVAKSPETSMTPFSVAYTDKVWSGGGNPALKTSAGVPLLTPKKLSEGQDIFYPYGALAFKGSDIKTLAGRSASLYAMMKAPDEGPYQPLAQVLPADRLPNSREDLVATLLRPLPGQPQGGYSYGCATGGDCTLANLPKGDTNTLKQFFARSYASIKWSAAGSYTDPGSANYVWDARSPATPTAAAHKPPLVYPIKQGSCRPTDGKCMMDLGAEGRITVNEKNDGVVSGSGTVKATVKFYFEVDKDHMPGKRIVVDWGDRLSDAEDLSINYGLYKNRIGLRQGGTDGIAGKLGCDGDQLFCSNDVNKQCRQNSDCGTGSCNSTGFGRSARACEDAYIAFSHTYTCDDTTYALGLSSGATALIDGKPSSDTAASKCVFRPRVMVLDNWGWCNGVCRGDSIIGDACFADAPVAYCAPERDITSSRSKSTTGDPNLIQDPWAYFTGTVEVKR